MTETPLTISQIRDTELLRAWLPLGQSKRLVLCFSGLGKDQTQPPGYERSTVAIGNIASASHLLESRAKAFTQENNGVWEGVSCVGG